MDSQAPPTPEDLRVDARSSVRLYERLLGDDLAQLVVTDPPYNVSIRGHVMGRGKVRHREFAMASGEMPEAAFIQFLSTFIRRVIACSTDGSIHFLFMDWRHLPELTVKAGERIGAGSHAVCPGVRRWRRTSAT
jgi:hypothetical protein